MLEFWTPDHRPPQIKPNAEKLVRGRIERDGIVSVAETGIDIILTEHEPLALYVSGLKQKFAHNPAELSATPQDTLNLGAAITMFAYRESGIRATVDQRVIDTGLTYAEMGGIGLTYATSAHSDVRLTALVNSVAESEELQGDWAPDQLASQHILLSFGSGVGRHFLQQAITAAN